MKGNDSIEIHMCISMLSHVFQIFQSYKKKWSQIATTSVSEEETSTPNEATKFEEVELQVTTKSEDKTLENVVTDSQESVPTEAVKIEDNKPDC